MWVPPVGLSARSLRRRHSHRDQAPPNAAHSGADRPLIPRCSTRRPLVPLFGSFKTRQLGGIADCPFSRGDSEPTATVDPWADAAASRSLPSQPSSSAPGNRGDRADGGGNRPRASPSVGAVREDLRPSRKAQSSATCQSPSLRSAFQKCRQRCRRTRCW
jgi:hypothetical protein